MSYVAPSLKPRFESLSIDLKNAILERDVRLNTLTDLINVLEKIVAEGEYSIVFVVFPVDEKKALRYNNIKMNGNITKVVSRMIGIF